MSNNTLLIIPIMVLLVGLVAVGIIIDPDFKTSNLKGNLDYNQLITEEIPFINSTNFFYDEKYLTTEFSNYNETHLNLSIHITPWEDNGFFVYKKIYYSYMNDDKWYQAELVGEDYNNKWIEGEANNNLLIENKDDLGYVLVFVCQRYDYEDLKLKNKFSELTDDQKNSLRDYLSNNKYLCGLKFINEEVVSNVWTLSHFIINPCAEDSECITYNNSGTCYYNGTCVEGVCEYETDWQPIIRSMVSDDKCYYNIEYRCTYQGIIVTNQTDNNKGCLDSICTASGWNNSLCPCINGDTQDCGSDVGACQKGIETCIQGVWENCTGNINPTTEILNNVDDDCDGEIDEGLCGNDYIDSGEECDGTNITTTNCADLTNMYEGILTCNNDCTLNTNDCCVLDCSNDDYCNEGCEQNNLCSNDVDCGECNATNICPEESVCVSGDCINQPPLMRFDSIDVIKLLNEVPYETRFDIYRGMDVDGFFGDLLGYIIQFDENYYNKTNENSNYVFYTSEDDYYYKYGNNSEPNHLSIRITVPKDVLFVNETIIQINNRDVYLPDVSRTDATKSCFVYFYVAENGSTYYMRNDKTCSYDPADLSPENAIISEQLARSNS